MTYNLFFLNSINKNKAETTVFSLKRIKCCFISFTLQTFTTVSMKKLKEDDFYSASSPTNNNVFQETGGGGVLIHLCVQLADKNLHSNLMSDLFGHL